MAEHPCLWLSTEALRPGATLAEDVVSAGGIPLARAGTALTRRHLRQMRLWGISGATVRPIADLHVAPLAAPSVVSQWLTIDEREPFMHALADFARARAAQRHAPEREGSLP